MASCVGSSENISVCKLGMQVHCRLWKQILHYIIRMLRFTQDLFIPHGQGFVALRILISGSLWPLVTLKTTGHRPRDPSSTWARATRGWNVKFLRDAKNSVWGYVELIFGYRMSEKGNSWIVTSFIRLWAVSSHPEGWKQAIAVRKLLRRLTTWSSLSALRKSQASRKTCYLQAARSYIVSD